MKIAYCLKSTNNAGGMERIVIAKANAIAAMGHSVTIITTDQRNRSPFFKINDNVSTVDLDINYDYVEKKPFYLKLIHRFFLLRLHKRRLNELCKDNKYDILISTYGNEINFISTIRHVKKKIAEIHFQKWYRILFDQSIFRKLVNRYIIYNNERKANKLDAFVCLTKEDSKEWKKIRNLYVIPNFIERKAPIPASVKSHRVVAVGRLSYEKGYDYLLESWSRVSKLYPDWILDIYGGGELKRELENLIEKLDLTESVVIHSPVSDIYSVLKDASVYCLTSRFEGLPMVLLEAMACGLPIISFACKCGPKDILSHTKAGLLIPPADTVGFANKLKDLMQSEELRSDMGKASYDEADNYLIGSVIPKWINLFEILMK